METFASQDDDAFGYTPDTAYFTLSGMFRQRLGDPAWRLTLNHLENYNFSTDWNIPVAPEAYSRSGELFGDQYSNFNAGKLLLYLEGLAGLEYSIPDNRLSVHDTMPSDWEWMEVRLPMRLSSREKTDWPVVRYERAETGNEITRSIRVTDCPLQITLAPWTEGKRATRTETLPKSAVRAAVLQHQQASSFTFGDDQSTAYVKLWMAPVSAAN